MNQTKKLLMVSVLAILWLSVSVFGASNDRTNGLWFRAVNLAKNNQRWVPANSYSKTIKSNFNGKVKNVEEYWERIFVDDQGEIQSELVKYLKNNKDMTTWKKKTYQKDNYESIQETLKTFHQEMNPFSAEIQQLITIRSSHRREVLNGEPCVVFEFDQKPINADDELKNGLAWISEKSGAPLAVKYYMENMPEGLKEYSIDIQFEYQSETEWYPVKLTFIIAGDILFFRQKLSVETVFSDFWNF